MFLTNQISKYTDGVKRGKTQHVVWLVQSKRQKRVCDDCQERVRRALQRLLQSSAILKHCSYFFKKHRFISLHNMISNSRDLFKKKNNNNQRCIENNSISNLRDILWSLAAIQSHLNKIVRLTCRLVATFLLTCLKEQTPLVTQCRSASGNILTFVTFNLSHWVHQLPLELSSTC